MEAEDASTFFAPHLVDRLTPGTLLSVARRAGASYLALDGLFLGRLPETAQSGDGTLVVRVAMTTRDGDGRLHLFVTLDRW